jgi:hypothetical protein
MKKILIGVLVCGVAITAWFLRGVISDWRIAANRTPVPSEQPRPSVTATLSPTSVSGGSPIPTLTLQPVLGGINLAVPFHAQAPRGDWELPWQEACEEASAILVDAYWQSEELSVEEMEARILSLVDWQERNLGYYQHTTSEETAYFLREALGYERVEVIYDITVDDIIEQVREHRPVIVPLAGRLLRNPYYTSPGPIYHMLVVKGVTDDGKLITNDVGTRHGRNYVYDADVFEAAIHDVPTGGDFWPPGTDPVSYILSGRTAMIVVYPNSEQ